MKLFLLQYGIYILIIIAGLLFLAWEMGRAWLKRQVIQDNLCPLCHGERF
jgi:hypothetical protein